MAKRETVEWFDDLTGDPIPDGTDHHVEFMVAGRFYEMDLNPASLEQLREAVRPFAEKARPLSAAENAAVRRYTAARGNYDMRKVRDWAKKKGLTIQDRGRLSKEVLDAYDKAH